MLTDLLELCGFAPEEVQQEFPRAQKTFDMLGLTSEDIERGEQRIRQFYDTELEGVRKALGVHMRELFDLVLAKEEGRQAIIHATVPMLAADVLTAVALRSDKVLVSFPDLTCIIMLGGFLDKLDHILEAAEKLWLSQQGAHCALIKARLGLYALNLIPKPDLFMSLGRTCDEAPKSDELVSRVFDVPVEYINLWQDQWYPELDFPRGRDVLAYDLERVQKKIEQVIGFEVTRDVLAESDRLREEFMTTLRKARDLMLYGDPAPLDLGSWQLFRRPAGRPQTRGNLKALTEAASILHRELEQRVNKGIGAVPKGAPRVMLACASYADPSFTCLVEGHGLALPVQETALYGPDGDFTRKVETKGKTFHQIASEKVLWKSNTAILPVRIGAVIAACKKYKIDGVLWNYHYPCRPSYGDSMMLKHAVEKELGIPFMIMEYDLFDSRFHTTPQLAARVETFAEMVKSDKAAKIAGV